MKKLVIFFILMLTPISAIAYECCEGCPVQTAVEPHDNNTQRQAWGYGIGADIVVAKPDKFGIKEITVEPRYDINNRETRVFVVARIDLIK